MLQHGKMKVNEDNKLTTDSFKMALVAFYLLLTLNTGYVEMVDSNTLMRCKPDQQNQCFEQVPYVKYEVSAGHNVVFPCKVRNLAGKVQWRLKDTMMGYEANSDIFPRFLLEGDHDAGDFQLHVKNASEIDQGEYECQVSPKAGNPLLRVSTQLVILRKPQKPFFLSHDNSKILQVNPKSTRTSVVCVSENGNPEASFTWYHNDKQMVSSEDTGVNIQNKNGRSQLSLLTANLRSRDAITCTVTNSAMQRESEHHDRNYQLTIEVQIAREPGQPIIQGYNRSWQYRVGDRLNVTCSAVAGMPQGSLVWKRIRRSGLEDTLSHRYHMKDSHMENSLTTVLTDLDHNANFICIAQNQISKTPKEANFLIQVEYPPASISVMMKNSASPTGKNITIDGSVGSSGILVCKTSVFYRKVRMGWLKETAWLKKEHYTDRIERNGSHGYIQISELRIQFHKSDNGCYYKCLVRSVGDVELVALAHVRVNFPPQKPTIKVQPPNGRVLLNQNFTLICATSEGNPLPSMSWYKDDQLIYNPIKSTIRANVVTSLLSIIPRISDNGAQISCMAINSALPIGIKSDPFKLNVLYPPQKIKLTITDVQPLAQNTSIIMRCEVDMSNPAPTITWSLIFCDLRRLSVIDTAFLTNCPHRDNVNKQTLLEFNRTSFNEQKYTVDNVVYVKSVSFVKLPITEQMDLAVVKCSATNRVFADHYVITDEQVLRVMYAPMLADGSDLLTVKPVLLGSDLKESISLLANPPLHDLDLRRIGFPSFQDDPRVQLNKEHMLLIMRKVLVEDMGNYLLIAKNSVGTAEFKLFINVTFPPRISYSQLSTNIPIWPEGDHHVTLECRATGNPLPHNIYWTRLSDGKNIACGQVVLDKGGHEKLLTKCNINLDQNIVNKLVILRTTRLDTGKYVCEADNGLEKPVRSSPINVMIDLKPELRMRNGRRRAAAKLNDAAILYCRVQAWPRPTMTWYSVSRDGLVQPLPTKTNKFIFDTIQLIDASLQATFQQKLTINDVQPVDYMEYRCQARNRRGETFVNINLTDTSRPDEPKELRAENATSTSVDVSWLAGHDGGYLQTFNIKYQLLNHPNAKYEDIGSPLDGKAYVQTRLNHLLPGNTYLIRVNARNAEHGASEYTSPIKITTLLHDGGAVISTSEQPDDNNNASLLVIVGCSIVGLFVFLLNVTCILLYLRRRRLGVCCRSSPDDQLNDRQNQSAYSDSLGKELEAVELYPQHHNTMSTQFNSCRHSMTNRSPSELQTLLYNVNNFGGEDVLSSSMIDHESCCCDKTACIINCDKQIYMRSECHPMLSCARPDVALSCSPKRADNLVSLDTLPPGPLLAPSSNTGSHGYATSSLSRNAPRNGASTWHDNSSSPAEYLDVMRPLSPICEHGAVRTDLSLRQTAPRRSFISYSHSPQQSTTSDGGSTRSQTQTSFHPTANRIQFATDLRNVQAVPISSASHFQRSSLSPTSNKGSSNTQASRFDSLENVTVPPPRDFSPVLDNKGSTFHSTAIQRNGAVTMLRPEETFYSEGHMV